MGGMNANWARLADAIRRRREALGFTQVQLAKLAEVTDTTIRNLEGGREFRRPPASLPAVERALGWSPGSARTILAGGDPALAIETARLDASAPHEVENDPDTPEGVGMIVRNTVIEVVGVLAPNTPLSEVQEIEARALEAVLRRGGRARQRHREAFQGTEAVDPEA